MRHTARVLAIAVVIGACLLIVKAANEAKALFSKQFLGPFRTSTEMQPATVRIIPDWQGRITAEWHEDWQNLLRLGNRLGIKRGSGDTRVACFRLIGLGHARTLVARKVNGECRLKQSK